MSDLFSKYAHQKMLDLYQHHEHEVGSELYKEDPQPGRWRPRTPIFMVSGEEIPQLLQVASFVRRGGLQAEPR